jgi:hypothetical protein
MGRKKAWVAAIISGLIACLTSLSTAFQGEKTGIDTITMGQWITAVVAFLVAFAGTGGLTYAVPNGGSSAPQGKESDTGHQAEPDGQETRKLVGQGETRP